MDLQTITSGVQALVDDPDGTYVDADYVRPLANIAYQELYNKLRETGYEFDEFVVELPGITAGTPDLSAQAASGKPLELLIQPRSIEWKLAGQDPNNYQMSDGPLDKVRDVIPEPELDSWTWRNGTIYLSRFTTTLDLRITGDFMFSAMTNPTDIARIGQNAGVVMQYMVAHLVAIARGNPVWMEQYEKKADDSFFTLYSAMTKGDQIKVRRVARMSRNITGRPIQRATT